MTIVKSLNEMTEGLGGNTTGAHTVEKAIDKLKTVVGGGGGTGGTANIVADFFNKSFSVTTSGLTPYEDAPKDKAFFGEHMQVDVNYTPSETGGMSIQLQNYPAAHSFQLGDSEGTTTLEVLSCFFVLPGITPAIDAQFSDGTRSSVTPAMALLVAFRSYKDGVWSDWDFAETIQ